MSFVVILALVIDTLFIVGGTSIALDAPGMMPTAIGGLTALIFALLSGAILFNARIVQLGSPGAMQRAIGLAAFFPAFAALIGSLDLGILSSQELAVIAILVVIGWLNVSAYRQRCP